MKTPEISYLAERLSIVALCRPSPAQKQYRAVLTVCYELLARTSLGQKTDNPIFIKNPAFDEIVKNAGEYIKHQTLKQNIMKTLQILKEKKEELIALTIELLPAAVSGDSVNRTFFFKEENGEIEVDYMIYSGNQNLSENCFFTIKNTETFEPSDYGVSEFSEIDFYALEWDVKIEEAIDQKIAEIEMYEQHDFDTMKTLFQTSEKNPKFSTRGNGKFENVIRTGWKPSRLGEKKKKLIFDALENSNVQEVYMKGNKIFAFLLNGTEKELKHI